HGTKDEAVTVDAAYAIHKHAANSELFILETDHVFNRKHPWMEDHLPEAMEQVVQRSIAFLKRWVS
ncbi:MAG: alpha/beta hydrolase, partial [Flavisolibacter sp.]|nr:alpha/beta hydrolase [Flavisolibacter sp.]